MKLDNFYRVVECEEGLFTIIESVESKNKLVAYTEPMLSFSCDSINTLENNLRRMLAAIGRPVVQYDDYPDREDK